MKKEKLIVLTGPTAVGKTELSLRLAADIGGEIVSADSMQVYRGMDIGSAKIPEKDRQGIPHHLLDICDPTEDFHVVRFQTEAKKCIREIQKRGHIPILTGGTGFYIQSVLYDIDFTEADEDTSFREELEKRAREEGCEVLHRELSEVDPEAAAAIHPHNVKRVIRALEFAAQTGGKISVHNEQERAKESPYLFAYLVLNRPRAELYERINRRVDVMMEEGLLDETRRLYEAGLTPDRVSMQGLGYKQLLSYLMGECSYEEAVDRIKKETRHFAKRQITWFKRERDVSWINRDEYPDEDAMYAAIREILNAKGLC
ncbi:MAG: tRNA (adenosine(37)-N6)-dimethylallyltransferase MiaA [Lachnospiraceae bacterium]|nr:tRNA (adenosine(37)-N6)-dimethylallyltransferase MiaA [Lachnospiraceae bacterium]